ncbi:MAG: hypothetical protein H6831_04880 [Planctomycetes bacterium]|nr:hypothetical protein [Planctomycetota bacterium]MCB9903724.1 hypothetical protein [Planctomycetota bacterium]
MLKRILSSGKARAAIKRLSEEPSARNYLALGQLHATAGKLGEVERVCLEGLEAYPDNAELKRLLARARQLRREDRTRELQAQLKVSPRPALWKELCEIHLESGRVARAEEVADEWFFATEDGEAMLMRAMARCDRFFADRRRDDGRRAHELIHEAIELLPGDKRPLRLLLDLTSRAGAWQNARSAIARLLELSPGDPALEARFRTVMALAERCGDFDQALRAVERSGRLADEDPEAERRATSGSVRPMLQELAAQDGVRGAFYVRGGTALVQGPRGATAERTARGVREVIQASRTAARRLGLGQPEEIRAEGDFGSLLARPGSTGASALWTQDGPTNKQTAKLDELTATAQSNLEEQS